MLNTRRSLLGALMGAFFALMFARLVVSPLVPAVVDAFAVTPGAVGLALTGMWLAYALTQLPAGILAARFGYRTLVVAGLLTTAAASVGLFLAPTFPAFGVLVVLLGVGPGLYFPAAAAVLTDAFENTGQALGLHFSGGDSAGIVAPLAVTAAMAALSWRAAFLVSAAIAVSMALLSAVVVENGSNTGGRGAATRGGDSALDDFRETLRRVATSPGIRRTTLLAALLAFAFQATVSFLPTFLVVHRDVPTGVANTLFAAAFAIWIIAIPLFGRLGDLTSTERVLAVTVGLMAAGVAALLALPAFAGVVAGVCLLGAGMGWGGAVSAKVMYHFETAERASGYGVVRATYVALGASSNVLLGSVATVWDWGVAWTVLFVVTLLAGGVLAWDVARR